MELNQDSSLSAFLSEKPKDNYYHITYRFTCPSRAFSQDMFQELLALTSKYESTLKEFSVN